MSLRGVVVAQSARERILAFIKVFRREKGYSPTVREIVTGVGMSSTSVVQYHLDRLQEQGRVSRMRGQPRTLVVIQ
jgi:repressor LexA